MSKPTVSNSQTVAPGEKRELPAGESEAAPRQELRGHLDECTAVSVTGWAAYDDGSTPELDVLVNGASVAKCVPNISRPDVAKIFPQNPTAGFSYRLERPLERGDNEIAIIDVSGRHLVGSPFRLVSISPQADFKRDFASIEGWYHPKILEYLELIDNHTDKLLSRRPVCEIGVHHGKFLIGAHNTLGGTPALGIDLFSLQDRNVDNSGRGDLDWTRSNIARYAAAPDRIELREVDSLDVSIADVSAILAKYKKFGLFSIDGGHAAENMANDFRIAQEVTAQEGLILIDDFFSYDWPGVTEAIMKEFHSGTPKFVPFFLAANKLFLCGASTYPMYYNTIVGCRDQLTRISPPTNAVRMFGYSMLICPP